MSEKFKKALRIAVNVGRGFEADAEDAAELLTLITGLESRIAELNAFIGKLIEAGDAMSNAHSMWVAEEDKWDALVKDWKEG